MSVTKTPFARVRVTIKRRGKTVRRATFPPRDSRYESYVDRWSCRSPGRRTLIVTARDRYGTAITRRHRVNVPTCAQVVRREQSLQRAYEQEQARKRRQCSRRGGRIVRQGGEERCVVRGIVIFVIFL